MPFVLKPWLNRPYLDLSAAFSLKRLQSSIIISGDLRLNTANLAVKTAMLYLCDHPEGNEPCGKCKSCQMLMDEGLSHPDFLAVLSSTKDAFDKGADLSHRVLDLYENAEDSSGTSLRIDSLRHFQEWASQSTMGSHGKVAVISNAHLMPEAAANAILKTFEEPPQDTLIIMLTKSLDALLPTILSRAFKVSVSAPDVDVATQELLDMQVDVTYAHQALALSGYAPSLAVTLIKSGKILKVLEIVDALANTLSKKVDPIFFVEKILENDKDKKSSVFTQEERVQILSEFVLELLKYKAGITQDKLPLLLNVDAKALVYIQAENLFASLQRLKFIKGGNNLSPIRAMQAVMRDFVNSLMS